MWCLESQWKYTNGIFFLGGANGSGEIESFADSFAFCQMDNFSSIR